MRLHISIPTMGRRSILALLGSLQAELTEKDFLTIMFDEQDRDQVFDAVRNMLKKSKATCDLQMMRISDHAVKPGPARAHRLRNTHTAGPGDFWMFADDDNIYLPGFAAKVKDVVSMDRGSPFFFKCYVVERDIHVWGNPDHEIRFGNIDTGCGVVPSSLVPKSTWGAPGLTAGGDFEYYRRLTQQLSRYHMVDIVIFNYTKSSAGL